MEKKGAVLGREEVLVGGERKRSGESQSGGGVEGVG
jgi:hypothetical protein